MPKIDYFGSKSQKSPSAGNPLSNPGGFRSQTRIWALSPDPRLNSMTREWARPY